MSKEGVTLEEAIETNKNIKEFEPLSSEEEMALQLGIEALGRVQYWREKVVKNPKARPSLEELQALLPSEEEKHE